MYQLALTEEPSFYDGFTSIDWLEFDRRKHALESVYSEAQTYGASIEAYRLWNEFQKAMRVNQLPQEPKVKRAPKVTVREVTNDPLVVRPSRWVIFLRRIITALFY